ncbi:MAG: beta-propeller repeat protein [Solirubrobacterales bacterium]|nr:beta-propeller repeat protein [Solirubrobacterales bacterium]
MVAGQRGRASRSATGHASTRRGFVAGMAAGGVAVVAGRSLPGAVAQAASVKPCEPTPPGVRTTAIAATRDGRTFWTADAAATTITAHRRDDLRRGRSIDVGGAPVDIAIAPDGRRALVTTASYDNPGLVLVDLRTGHVDHLDVGPEPYAVAFTASGRSAYVSGGGREGTLTRVDPRTGRVHAPVPVGAHARGLALHPDGKHALVALNGEAAVAVVALRKGRIVRRIATPLFPAQLAVSPDGRRALVTHNGFGDRRVTPLDLVAWRARRPIATGLDPAGVAFGRSGTLALVANAGAGTVCVLDARTGRRRRRVTTGGTPRHVVISGRQGIVADGHTGRLTAVRLSGGR